jgi:hypothetical protein
VKHGQELGEEPAVLNGEVFHAEAAPVFIFTKQCPRRLALAPMALQVTSPNEGVGGFGIESVVVKTMRLTRLDRSNSKG